MLPILSDEVLKTTQTKCQFCGVLVQGEVKKRNNQVFLSRVCPEHGEHTTLISSDARLYWTSLGGECCSASTEGCCGTLGQNAHNPDTIERLSTCLALIEIVDSCNLSCPTCFASSLNGALNYSSLSEIQDRITKVISRKGKIEILQLSGGEPTLHPQFIELLEWAQSHPKIDVTLVNSNGIKIARDKEFREKLKKVLEKRRIQMYLQFDGFSKEVTRLIRGADLVELKKDIIKRCAEISFPTTLAMTVVKENLDEVWEVIKFGLEYPIVHGVSFQPLFSSGRQLAKTEGRLSSADIILKAIEKSEGLLSLKDFTPLPCGDPNCAVIGYLLRIGGSSLPISHFINFSNVQGFLKDRINYNLNDLSQCGCEIEPLGQILHQLEAQAPVPFRIMVKPFMDNETWDQDRIDRCCTHVIRKDGSLDSFCRYYANGGNAAFKN